MFPVWDTAFFIGILSHLEPNLLQGNVLHYLSTGDVLILYMPEENGLILSMWLSIFDSKCSKELNLSALFNIYIGRY